MSPKKYQVIVLNNKDRVYSYDSVDYPQMVMNGGYVTLNFMEVKPDGTMKKCDLLVTTPYWVAIHEV